MRALLSLALAAAIGIATLQALPRASAAPFPTDAEVLAIVKQRVQEKRSTGIVVGLVEADGRMRVVSFGDSGPGQPPLDGDSVFEIGSISKVFTSTVLAELVQEGVIKLDDPVQKYVPAGVTIPDRNGKQITVGNLAEQNSGLPRMPNNFHPKDLSNPYADYGVQDMYAFLSGYTLPRDPGALFEYSNLGVGLLGNVLASATKRSYEDLQRERVWQPLGMTHTAITFTPWMKQHLALGHDAQGAVVANWDLGAMAGAGAIRSTAGDMLKFAAANLKGDGGPLERAMAFAQKPRAPAGNAQIGLNWLTVHPGTETIVWHNGGTGGYRTYLGLIPTKHLGVVVLTNSGGAGADDIGMHLLDPTLPLTPAPAAQKVRTAIELPVSALGKYPGVYQLNPSFSITVTLDGSALMAQATGQQSYRLWPEASGDFFIKEVDAQISFAKDKDGNVTALTLHQNGANQTAYKVK